MNFDTHAFAHGPVESKIWLCHELIRLNLQPVHSVFVLGAWSGTMPFLLHATAAVDYRQMILVDTDADYLAQSRVICNAIECAGQLTVLDQDANTVQFPADQTCMVINTSTDNIDGFDWWNNIPAGTLVALQGRTGGHRDCVLAFDTVAEFDLAYPMALVHCIDQRRFVYPDHTYTRFMKIGIK